VRKGTKKSIIRKRKGKEKKMVVRRMRWMRAG